MDALADYARAMVRAREPRPVLALAFTLLAGACSLVGACASRPAQTGSGEAGMPADFAIAIAVPPGLEVESAGRRSPLTRPAYYMLDADGVLRASLGPPRFDSPPPPRVRTLSREQVESVWRGLEGAGVLSPASVGDPVGDASQGVADRAGVGVWWSARGRRRSLLLAPRADSAASVAIARTIDRLRGLAWGEAR
jgi:hypothetical protein